MSSALDLAHQLHQQFTGVLAPPVEFRGEISVSLNKASRLSEVMQYVQSTLAFDMLLDITSIDHFGSEPRFEIVYHLYSFTSHQYLRIKVLVSEENPEISSVTNLWPAADWHEREVFDMMGIRFKGHPDLRRILMWDEYPHYPLRKEFPLAGLPTTEWVKPAPMAGGPFVTSPGEKPTIDREPRSKG